MTERPRLWERLPAVYGERDADPAIAGQFEAYVGLIDEVLEAIDHHVEQLYHDHFVEFCDDWVVPYIGDLLGVSHLKGPPETIRADVARAIALRRRKGSRGAMELLAFSLTGWAGHAVELRERLVWNQHLNHQRPDRGGRPRADAPAHLALPVRHGTVNLRDPGVLSFLGGAFDDFARTADLKPTRGRIGRPNLPNMALFLWTLTDHLVRVSRPVHVRTLSVSSPAPGEAPVVARYIIHPLGRMTRIFDTFRYDPSTEPPEYSTPDRTPGPMPAARLQDGPPTGNAAEHVAIDIYSGSAPDRPGANAPGLTLHLPDAPFAGTTWTTRGANLCAWENGLHEPLREREIAIDPVRGRLLFGLSDQLPESRRLRSRLRVSYAYASPGEVGAHPVARSFDDTIWPDLAAPEVVQVSAHPGQTSLRTALSGLSQPGPPRIIEIVDSMTHAVNLADVDDIVDEGGPTLALARPFWIRARAFERPVVEFRQPLRMRATDPADDGLNRSLDLRIEGCLVTLRSAPAGAAIVERAAVNRIAFVGSTLDPCGHTLLDGTPTGTRAPMQAAFDLEGDFGFTDRAAFEAFDETPEIVLEKSISGPIGLAGVYRLAVADSIVDGGAGPGDEPAFAVSAAADPQTRYGPRTTLKGATFLGRVRVREIDGEGGVFVHRLEARDHQSGCLRFSRFSGDGDRLPPHFACMFGPSAVVSFDAERSDEPAYGRLNRARTDRRVLEDGPEADEMGAFGHRLDTHRWSNLSIRLREFTPVGVRAIPVAVT